MIMLIYRIPEVSGSVISTEIAYPDCGFRGILQSVLA